MKSMPGAHPGHLSDSALLLPPELCPGVKSHLLHLPPHKLAVLAALNACSHTVLGTFFLKKCGFPADQQGVEKELEQ